MQAFHLQFSEGLLCFLPRNFKDIFSPEKLNCCLNVRNAVVSVQGAVQQFQLPCVCREGFLTFRKRSPAVLSTAFYSAHSSEAIIQLWQNRSVQVPPRNLAQAARSPRHHLALSEASSTTSRNPEQLLLYEHFQHVLGLLWDVLTWHLVSREPLEKTLRCSPKGWLHKSYRCVHIACAFQKEVNKLLVLWCR